MTLSPHNHISINAKRISNLPNLTSGDSHPDLVEVQNYLERYGYLVKENCVAGQLCPITEESLRKFQGFYGLPDTGSIDELTREEMSSPRCGMPDHPGLLEFATVGGWNRRNLTFAFGTDTADAVGAAAARNAIRRAFGSYQAAGIGFTFTEVTTDPDIEVEWRPTADPDRDMTGNVIAHADFPPGFSIIAAGLPLPLHFDDGEHTWVDGAMPGGFDIETVALHEIGHCLGLLHTGVAGSVMFPRIGANTTLTTLQADDIASLNALFPRNGTLNTAASWGPNRYDVFGQAQNGDVLQLWWNGRNWNRNNLGNGFGSDRFTGQLTAASWGANRLDVFGLGANGNVLQLWWDGRWHWSDLGNGFAGTRFFGPITATSWGPNRYDIFGYNARGDILQLWWNGQWNWNNLGNSFTSSRFAGPLSAASWGAGRLDVFSLGPNGDTLQLWWNGQWNWNNLGNSFAGDRFNGLLAAASWGRNRLDIFGLGQSSNVLQLWWNGRRWNWNNLGSIS